MGSVKNFILSFCTFLAIAAVTSCSNEEESFFFDEEGVPMSVNSQRVSEEQFEATINGAGWVETVTHEIFSNGDFDKRDYWDDMEGGGPSRFCMKGDTITEYLFLDFLPKTGVNARSMRYDASTNTLYADGKMLLRIISVKGGWMQAIKFAGLSYKQRSKSRALYFYVTLRRMSDDERKDLEEF